jgi:hypothetical protein
MSKTTWLKSNRSKMSKEELSLLDYKLAKFKQLNEHYELHMNAKEKHDNKSLEAWWKDFPYYRVSEVLHKYKISKKKKLTLTDIAKIRFGEDLKHWNRNIDNLERAEDRIFEN